MDDVKDVDFNPLVRLLTEIDESEINGVDILQRSSCLMSVEHVLFLLHIIRKKLRVVDLLDLTFGKKFLLYELTQFYYLSVQPIQYLSITFMANIVHMTM